MRYALKFGYHGKNFSGYARQPNLRTIEGDIYEALKKTKMIGNEESANFQSASRTDKGVSASGNVLAVNTDFRRDEILPALNANLKEIWFYGMAEVPIDFNPRYAKKRWYRYYLINEDYDQDIIKDAAKIFLGTHDFSNFAKLEEGKNPKRTMDALDISKKGDFIILDFTAQSFLWHMVRRIVSAIVGVVKGNVSYEEVKNSLDSKHKKDFGCAPPEPLILMDVGYDFEFDLDLNKLGPMKNSLEKNLRMQQIDHMIYNRMLDIIKSEDKM
ncbi:MAG: tRNA pseudouridine(38-40) synthase TruA [Thermoplasmata archaeon]|nr:MAG: tRNA pseudouridine(38-40) synthase TruA [Thermoplasmata archaeon]